MLDWIPVGLRLLGRLFDRRRVKYIGPTYRDCTFVILIDQRIVGEGTETTGFEAEEGKGDDGDPSQETDHGS